MTDSSLVESTATLNRRTFLRGAAWGGLMFAGSVSIAHSLAQEARRPPDMAPPACPDPMRRSLGEKFDSTIDPEAVRGDRLLAGAARVEITPPLASKLSGFGPNYHRLATAVRDPLHARALMLELNGERLLLVSGDLIGVDCHVSQRFSVWAEQTLQVPRHRVWLMATHTHSGPASLFLLDWGGYDSAYLSLLEQQLREAATGALSNLVPARVAFGSASVSGVGLNRVESNGPVERRLHVARFDRVADGQPVAELLNYGAHPVIHWPMSTQISADYPGRTCGLVEQTFPGSVCLYMQGACGDVNARMPAQDATLGPPAVEQVSRALAGRAVVELARLNSSGVTSFRAARWKVELPHVWPNADQLRDHLRRQERHADRLMRDRDQYSVERFQQQAAQVQFALDWARLRLNQMKHVEQPVTPTVIHAVRLGPALLVGLPAEVFCELGQAIRARGPTRQTFVTTFVHDDVGYIPTRKPYIDVACGKKTGTGWYEAEGAPRLYGRFSFKPHVGDLLVREAVHLSHVLCT